MISINNPDKHLEDEGVWTSFRGSDFLVANVNNFRFQKMFARLQMPHRRRIEKGNLDPEIGLDILCKSLSKTVILDWRKVTDNEGTEVPFSSEMCAEALANNADLREYIQEYAADLENFKEEEKEELGKS